MTYEYLVENYNNGDPIFLSELPGESRDYLRQEMKRLTDDGKLERFQNGVYYLAYNTILGTKGKMSIDRYIEKKYLSADGKTKGFITGLQLVNQYGFTTQNPAYYEICSNEATTKQRKQIVDGYTMIIYRPVTVITDKNVSALRFLDLMQNIDRYSEIGGREYKQKLNRFIEKTNVDFKEVKKLVSLYPDKVFRNIYEGDIIDKLV